MSFKDEMQKIQAVKAKSPMEIKQEKLNKAYAVIEWFLEKEFPLYEEYLLDLVKEQIEKDLRNGKFSIRKTKNGEIKKVKGEIEIFSDTEPDRDRVSKPVYKAKIPDHKLIVAQDAREAFYTRLGVNCEYKGVGLNIGIVSLTLNDNAIVYVKDGYYGKLLKEYFKKVKEQEEIEIQFHTSQKRTLVDNEIYYIMKISYRFEV